MKLQLIADQALGETETRQSDGLGFEVYAKVLAQAALDTSGPFTIGIFGEWGTGKTSLMRLIESKLTNQPNVVTVWFNAWRYEKEEHPIVPLVGTIIQQLESNRSFLQRYEKATHSLIRALRAIAYGFSAKSRVKVPGFAEIEASFVAKDMIDRKERLTPDPLLDRSLYYGAFSSLDSVDLDNELRVVILIDDLDRCFPDQAIRLLESMKLVLAQSGFIFILGVARQVIEGYLQHRYASDFGITDFQGQLYLDKIVQMPFHIPPAAGHMNNFTKRILEGQSFEITSELSQILPTVAEALGGNPRAVIRFTNNILIDLAINFELSAAGLMEEIPINYFAISRCLEHRWPEVFSDLVRSSELANDVAEWDKAGTMNIAETSGPRARMAASLVSDQRLAALMLGNEGKSWLRNEQLRAASIGFLRTQRRTSDLDVAETLVEYDTFISHDALDRAEVVKLVQTLSERGLRTFFDIDVHEGDVLSGVLRATMARSRTVCFCIGRNSALSEAQTLELDYAAKSEKFALAVLLPDTNGGPELMGNAISAFNCLRVSPDTGAGIDELCRLIETSPSLSNRRRRRRRRRPPGETFQVPETTFQPPPVMFQPPPA